MPDSPYTGLQPFTEEQAPFFFGREAEREIISANLIASRLTLLYGPSGVGKSSVLNAGVAYHLRDAERDAVTRQRSPEYAIVVFRAWRDDPLVGLYRAIGEAMGSTTENGTFVDRLQAWSERLEGDLLIVLDQFEEYFLYHGGDDRDGSFALEFPRAVNQRGLHVNFLVSMREDSIAKLDFFKGRIPNLFDNYLRIDHLEREQARDAISKPLAVYNKLHGGSVTIEDALVARVLDEVKTGRVTAETMGRGALQASTGAAHHSRIETPYLQLVMTRLWAEETRAGSSVLRTSTLERLGGANRIVATHLDTALESLTKAERDLAAEMFQRLVTPARTKIALSIDDLAGYARRDTDVLRPLLIKLSSGDNRILVPVAPAPDQPGRERYQIFHDVLAGAVLDWRSKYVKSAEQQAAEAAAREAQARAEKEARDARRLRRALVVIGLLFIATVSAVLYARSQTNRARATVAAAQVESAALQASADLKTEAARSAFESAMTTAKETAALYAEAAKLGPGQSARAEVMRQQADALGAKSNAAYQNATRLSNEAEKERAAAAAALAKAGSLLEGRSPVRQDNASPQPPSDQTPSPVDVPNPPTTTVVVPDPKVSEIPPAQPESATLTPPESTSPAPRQTPPPGDYRATYIKAIEAKNFRRWEQAADLFRAALALRGDTGERIRISGSGNIEPYVPQYYLGLALKNMGDCPGALREWERAVAAGVVQRTELGRDLQQNQRQCQQTR